MSTAPASLISHAVLHSKIDYPMLESTALKIVVNLLEHPQGATK